jgi:hypothetical protein
MPLLRHVSEGLARKTTRRGLLGRGAVVAFSALAGVATGAAADSALAGGGGTVCAFPFGRACPCDGCQASGVCAKPCLINTTWYATGCWVSGNVTCCDCSCVAIGGTSACGCGSDYHNDIGYCPDGNAG